MNLEEIENMWANDASLLANEENIGRNSLRISIYHSKYDNILTREEYCLIELKKKYNHVRMQKYNLIADGASSKKSLEDDPELPLHRMVKSKGEADIYLDGNSILQELQVKVEMCQTRIKKLERIITRINALNWDYKNYISMRQFENGN